MRRFLQNGLYWGRVISIGIILGIGIQFAEAWTNPTSPAPGGNLPGPINTGVFNQVKNAGLGLTGNLVVGGNTKLGNAAATCNATIAGTIRYNTTLKCVELCDGTAWTCVGGSPIPVSVDGACGSTANSCTRGSFQAVGTHYNCAEPYGCDWGACAGSVACDTDAVGYRNNTSSSMCSGYSVCWGDGSYDTGTRCRCKQYTRWNCLGANGGLNASCSVGVQW